MGIDINEEMDWFWMKVLAIIGTIVFVIAVFFALF